MAGEAWRTRRIISDPTTDTLGELANIFKNNLDSIRYVSLPVYGAPSYDEALADLSPGDIVSRRISAATNIATHAAWKLIPLEYDEGSPIENVPDIFDHASLCELLGIRAKRGLLWYIAKNTASFYNTFWVDKDTHESVFEFDENRRLREINAPNGTLKFIQKSLAIELWNKFRKHEANYAYMQGRSIKDACDQQVDYDLTIGVDLHDFFGSHTLPFLIKAIKKLTGYTHQLCVLLAKLCTLNGKMPQGAPTSPILSIILNYDMDCKIKELATMHQLTYTRYADDLHFSGNERSNADCYRFVNELSRELKPFILNVKKTRIMREHTYTYTRGYTVATDVSPESFLIDSDAWFGDPTNAEVTSDGETLSIVLVKKEDVLCGKAIEMLPIITSVFEGSNAVIKPIPWYEQSIRRMLGLHLSDVVRYPRAKYSQLRLGAMLYGKGVHRNPSAFRGTLSYIKMVDRPKYDRLLAIVNKYKGEN